MRPRQAIATLAALLSVASVSEPAFGADGWNWPLGSSAPVIVHVFDPPAEAWQPGHRGVDLAGTKGEPVYSAGAGVVMYAGLVAGVGVVTVAHGELRTTYQPVAATVRAGSHVEAGQQVGTLAVAGSHCAPLACLHWGLLRRDVYLDPTSLVPTAGRPRLLPLGSSALRVHSVERDDDGLPSSIAGAVPLMREGVSGQAAIGALAGVGR